MAELGDNYERYHGFLVRLSRDLGPLPDASGFSKNPDGYSEACAIRQEVRLAELILRRCRDHRRRRVPLDESVDGDIPIMDEQNRLVSVITEASDPTDAGFVDQPGWEPPKPVSPWS